MIGFNFLREPFVSSARVRIPERCVPGALALATACAIVLASWGIERSQLRRAEADVSRTQSAYAAVLERAKHGQVATVHARDLLALDSTLASIRTSGARKGARLAAIATQLPRMAWLTAVAPDSGAIALTGTADGATTVAAVLERLGGSRFGGVTLTRMSRVERPKQKPVLAFVAILGKKR